MAEGRDQKGRFAKGHAKLKGSGRPEGAVTVITKTLRERIIDGFEEDGGVVNFVKELKKEFPPAAAGLLARMIPPAPEENAAGDGLCVNTIVPVVIPTGCFLTAEQAAFLARIEPLDDAANFDANKFLADFAAVSPEAPVIDLEVAAPEPPSLQSHSPPMLRVIEADADDPKPPRYDKTR